MKRAKDRSNLVARKKIRARGRRHYLYAYLWRDRESMVQNSTGGDEKTVALCNPNSYTFKIDNMDSWEGVRRVSNPMLAEIHFVVDDWDGEIVAHELCHALLQRIRAVGPPQDILLTQEPMEAEEAVCHEFGQWYDKTYKWLWGLDPNKKWKRVTNE